MKNTSRVDIGGITFFCIPKVAGSSVKAALLRWQGYLVAHYRWVHNHPALKGVGGFKCAVIRHPLDRLVSCWEDKKKSPTPNLTRLGFDPEWEFSRFLHFVANDPYADHHFRPQSWFIEEAPDLMWRLEDMTAGWKLLQERYPDIPNLQKENPSERGAWKKYFSDQEMRKFMKIYEEDMNTYQSTAPLA